MNPNRRTRTTLRSSLVGIAATAFLIVGAAACSDDDDTTGGTDVPTETVDSTDAPPPTEQVDTTDAPPSTEPVDTTDPAPEGTDAPQPTTTADQPPVGAPTVVYATTGSPIDPEGELTLFDPTDGSVVGTEAIDVEASQSAQDALPGGVISTVDLGDVAYTFDPVVYDGGTLDTDFYTDVDLCGQNVVTVESSAGSALPERAHLLSVSSDGRYVVTLSSECPEAGTMGADGVGTQIPLDRKSVV